MRKLQPERLERLVATIFERAESSPEEARTIARHLVGANLVGHDSHGVIRVNCLLNLLVLRMGQVHAARGGGREWDSLRAN